MKQKYSYNLDIFYREDALSYYLLGVWYTDGNVYVGAKRILPSISSTDLDWLEAIRNLICPNLKISKQGHCYKLNIYSTELGRWLISKGCIPNKSRTLQFPNLPTQYVPDFIRGCVDGDGSLGLYKNKSKYNAQFQIVSGSYDFILQLQKVLHQNDFQTHLTERKPSSDIRIMKNGSLMTEHNTYYYLKMGGYQTKHLVNWLCYNNAFSLQRKAKVAKLINEYYDW